MSKEDKKEEVKSFKVELTVDEMNEILEVFNVAIKAPGTNVDSLYGLKSKFGSRFQESANK